MPDEQNAGSEEVTLYERNPRRRPRHKRGGGSRSKGRNSSTYAALDLGTNNCRLLVARDQGDSFRIIDSYSRVVRLGQGLAATGYHAGGHKPTRGKSASCDGGLIAYRGRHPVRARAGN